MDQPQSWLNQELVSNRTSSQNDSDGPWKESVEQTTRQMVGNSITWNIGNVTDTDCKWACVFAPFDLVYPVHGFWWTAKNNVMRPES